jgi:transcriptional regulator with XRE-family HTH domain
MDIGRIKAARESCRLKQYELAEIAGISPSQMSRVESGERRLRLDEAEKIANRLNLNVLEIIEERPPGTPRKEGARTASLPLPEGTATVQFPAPLSPQSCEELKQWLELIARLVPRCL